MLSVAYREYLALWYDSPKLGTPLLHSGGKATKVLK